MAAKEPADAPVRDGPKGSRAPAAELPEPAKATKQRDSGSRDLAVGPAARAPPPAKQPKKSSDASRKSALEQAFATTEDDLVDTRADALLALKHKQKKSEMSEMLAHTVTDMPHFWQVPLSKERQRSRSRDRDRDRDRDRRGAERDRGESRERQPLAEKPRDDKRRRSPPPYEGLDAIKAEYLRERGLKPGKKRRPRREVVPWVD